MFQDQQSPPSISSAIDDFRRARNKANLKEILARLTGKPSQLLSFAEARQYFKLQSSTNKGLRDIPIASIVGSVGRYSDFTRDFLPKSTVDAERWARVKVLASGLVGLPPIEVYQIGDVYFVKDGNHRISVARRLGASHIQAYVTEVTSRVPLTPDINPDELILKGEYNDFLEQTHLDQLRPNADLSVTVPGKYPIILEHIDVHRYFLSLDTGRGISYKTAVKSWFDTVYMPVVHIIRELGILHRFPGRTETDLYIWLAEHRAHLEEQLGWEIHTEYVASDLLEKAEQYRSNLINRIGHRLLRVIIPEKLAPGPPAGLWRETTLAMHSRETLFSEILVPINGKDDGWNALEQAIIVAQKEHAKIHGLHILPYGDESSLEIIDEIKEEFQQRCDRGSIVGDFLIRSGEISTQICEHANVTDLVVLNLSFPPEPQPLAKLGSGFHDLIAHCSRPILVTPKTSTPINRALLAFDGSPKSKEALFISTYLAGKWSIPLFVISVSDADKVTRDTLNEADNYLKEHGIEAILVYSSPPIAQAILKTARDNQCDLLVMGGYGLNPMLEVVLGSSVNHILRETTIPILICR